MTSAATEITPRPMVVTSVGRTLTVVVTMVILEIVLLLVTVLFTVVVTVQLIVEVVLALMTRREPPVPDALTNGDFAAAGPGE